jgi:hypothetical protein
MYGAADHPSSEDEAVGGAPELEVTEFLAVDDMVSGFDARVDETGADRCQSHGRQFLAR